MPNRPARFTTADLRRALKAAGQAGPEWFVDVLPDGTIRIKRSVLEKPPEPDWGRRCPVTMPIARDQAASGPRQP